MKQLSSLILLTFSLSTFGSEFYQVKEAKKYLKNSYEISDRAGFQLKIASHLYSNKNSKLAFVVHGYGDNCAYLKPVTRFFLQEKYDVLCIELPGHGESTGKRADISQIEAYADVYKNIFPKLNGLKYDSMIFFAHSTGNTGMLEYLMDGDSHPFKKVIMAAPLVRSYLWNLSRFGQRIFGGFLSKLPRRPSSIDEKEFKELKKMDPAPIKSVPTHWFQELVNWNKKLEKDERRSSEQIEVIFATKDTVIDYDFNRDFIQKRFENAHIQTVKGSDHLIFWEEEAYQKQFFQYLSEIIATK